MSAKDRRLFLTHLTPVRESGHGPLGTRDLHWHSSWCFLKSEPTWTCMNAQNVCYNVRNSHHCTPANGWYLDGNDDTLFVGIGFHKEGLWDSIGLTVGILQYVVGWTIPGATDKEWCLGGQQSMQVCAWSLPGCKLCSSPDCIGTECMWNCDRDADPVT